MSDNIRAEAVIDLNAVRHNVRLLLATARKANPAVELMAVMKADGYGHGGVEMARAARQGGATALGVAMPSEAVALVEAGIPSTTDRPIVAWLWIPDEDIRPALALGVQLVISSGGQLAAVLAAADRATDVQLKIDTGLGRGGATAADFGALVRAAAQAERANRIRVVGLMSHLARADEPGDESVGQQVVEFERAIAVATAAGLTPRWRHLANTPGTLAWPETTYDLVRCGIGVYGISPFDVPVPGLRAAMTLRARVALTKRVPAGHGVSYGHRYRTAAEATLALIPVGYADGIPRTAAGAEVFLAGKRRRIAGRIAMDQFVVDCGDDEVAPGDEVLIFGDGARGEPTAADWATADDTIAYEIVTRIGERIPRRYVGKSAAE